jgi:hypothetical protein
MSIEEAVYGPAYPRWAALFEKDEVRQALARELIAAESQASEERREANRQIRKLEEELAEAARLLSFYDRTTSNDPARRSFAARRGSFLRKHGR